MKLEDIAFLACRLFALYAFFQAVHYGFWAFEPLIRGKAEILIDDTGGMSKLYTAFSIAVGAVLWFGASWLARITVAPRGAKPAATQADHSPLYSAIFAGVGLFLLITGLGYVLGHLLAITSLPDMHQGSGLKFALLQTQFLYAAFKTIAGLLILITAKDIAVLILRLRRYLRNSDGAVLPQTNKSE